ncbi:hypothetical protein QOT17_015621 [Balamuthia mandrillaris]
MRSNLRPQWQTKVSALDDQPTLASLALFIRLFVCSLPHQLTNQSTLHLNITNQPTNQKWNNGGGSSGGEWKPHISMLYDCVRVRIWVKFANCCWGQAKTRRNKAAILARVLWWMSFQPEFRGYVRQIVFCRLLIREVANQAMRENHSNQSEIFHEKDMINNGKFITAEERAVFAIWMLNKMQALTSKAIKRKRQQRRQKKRQRLQTKKLLFRPQEARLFQHCLMTLLMNFCCGLR